MRFLPRCWLSCTANLESSRICVCSDPPLPGIQSFLLQYQKLISSSTKLLLFLAAFFFFSFFLSFQIPLPVTSGLFLYLGVSGLAGNEMWERTKLLVTDKKLRPKNVSVVFVCLFCCCGACCTVDRRLFIHARFFSLRAVTCRVISNLEGNTLDLLSLQ